jgi:hypothetical protein
MDGGATWWDGDDVAVEQPRAFSRIGRAPDFAAGPSANQRTAEKALEIEHKVGLYTDAKLPHPSGKTEPAEQSAKLFSGKFDDFIKEWIAGQKRSPLRIDHPDKPRIRPPTLDGSDGGQGVDNIAERTRFDDEDGARLSHRAAE